MKRKCRYIATRICGSLVILLLSIIFVLQLPSVQTRLAGIATEKLNALIDGNVSLSAIRIIPPGSVVLKDLVIVDKHPLARPDTFFFAKTVAASLSWKWLFTNDGIDLSKVKVKNGGMVLVSEASQHRTNLARIFGIIPPNVPAEPVPGTIFNIDRVMVENFHFRLKNRKDETIFPAPYGFDFADLDVFTDIIGHDMHFTNGVMYATCDHCSIWDDIRGYRIASLTGNCRVGQGMTLVQNIHLVDNWSDLQLKSFSMEYRKRHGIKQFATQVKLGVNFGGGHLALASVDMFTHSFKNNPIDLDLPGGSVYGYLYDLGINNLKFHDRHSGLSGKIDGRMTGLPDTDRFGVSLRLEDFVTTTGGIENLVCSFSPDSNVNLSEMAKGQVFHINADISGPMNRIRAEFNIGTASGKLHAKARVHNILNRFKPIVIDGSMTTDHLDLSRIISRQPVGHLTMGINFYAKLSPEKPEISIDTLSVETIDLFAGNYGNITARASLKDDKIDLNLTSEDPNLDLVIDAGATIGGKRKINSLRLEALFHNINLDTLGLLTKVPLNGIRTKIKANIKENERGLLVGDVNIPNVSMSTEDGIVNTGAINLKARYGSSTQRISLTSNILEASYIGSDGLSRFLTDMKKNTVDRFLPSLTGTPDGLAPVTEKENCSYDLAVRFRKSADVLGTFIPGMQMADSTIVRINMDNSEVRGSLSSSLIGLGGISARKIDLSFDNVENGLNAYILSKVISLGRIRIKNGTTSLSARNDKLNARLNFDNSNLNLDCLLSRDSRDSLLISVQPYKSFFNFEGKRWNMKGLVMMRGGGIKLEDLSISSGNDKINLYGGIGFERRDTLKLDAHNFELSFFDKLMGLEMNAGGTLDGHGIVSLPLENADDLDLNIELRNTSIGGAALGDFSMNGHWNDEKRSIIGQLSNRHAGTESISAFASFSPERKKIEGRIKLDSLNLAIAKPFLNELLTNLEGYLNGDFTIDGDNGKIKITEEGACLQNALVTLAPTGVTYIINGDLDMNSEGIGFNKLAITDSDNGKGELSGNINFGKQGSGLNLGFSFSDLKLIDTPQQAFMPVYGNVSASGNLSLSGKGNHIKITGDLNADKIGNVHVPLNTALVSSTSDLLTFVSQIEYGKHEFQIKNENTTDKKKTKLEIDARLRISPELTTWIEIDKTTNNRMTVRGDGDVSLKVNSSTGKLHLNGIYTIQDGDYHFVVPGLLEKDFNIKQGSSVTMAGELADTRLDIKAGHPVRASISTLLSDTTAVGSRQAVDCIIGINGSLKGPKLSFDIDIPEVDPSTRALVESALNTEDKRQKQFMSLLVLGTFLPAEESGVVNGTNMLFSNVGEIMSGQINSIMQKLDIPVDFGFGYQQSLSGGNMYDVAISTQLFNNRVMVNGSVGSRQNRSSANQSDVVGDIDVSVKIDKKGMWRVTVFSHSANEYTSFLDNSQRNGVGISYQKEFNRLKELFMSRKKLEAIKVEEKKRINIKVE